MVPSEGRKWSGVAYSLRVGGDIKGRGGGLGTPPLVESSCIMRTGLLVGALNVRGVSSPGTEWKMEEIGRMFESRGMDVLALSETKMKGRGEVMFGSVNGRKSGVDAGHGREGVALIVKEELIEYVREWKEVSSRLMWVRMRFGADSWVFVSAYGPGKDKSDKEAEIFWDELRNCIQDFRVGEKVVVLGDLNARVGSCAIPGIIGNFGVEGVNDNGEKMIEMCGECEMAVGNTFFLIREGSIRSHG